MVGKVAVARRAEIMRPNGFSDLIKSSQLKLLMVYSMKNHNPSKLKVGMGALVQTALSKRIFANNTDGIVVVGVYSKWRPRHTVIQ